MARSRMDKFREAVVKVLMIGLLLGFMPYILYRAACTETPNVQRINNQLDSAADHRQRMFDHLSPARFLLYSKKVLKLRPT